MAQPTVQDAPQDDQVAQEENQQPENQQAEAESPPAEETAQEEKPQREIDPSLPYNDVVRGAAVWGALEIGPARRPSIVDPDKLVDLLTHLRDEEGYDLPLQRHLRRLLDLQRQDAQRQRHRRAL